MATEVERKYEVPDGFVIPDLRDIDAIAAVDEPESMDLDATYYDTADLRLSQGRVTLRRRTGGHDAGWHLKRPAGSGFEAGDRSEIEAPLSDDPPPSLLDLVASLRGDALLVPIVRIRNHRRERAVRDATGDILVLIAEDDVTSDALIGPPRHRAWRELEVELVSGPRTLLDRIQTSLYAAGATASPSASKFARALQQDGPEPEGPLSGYVAAQLAAIDANDAGVRADDPESVHDMRVAVRRLRATMRTFRALLPSDRSEPLRDDLRWLAARLGAVRDGDVLTARFDAMAGATAGRIRARLAEGQARNRTELAVALDSERYRDLRRSLAALLDVIPRPVPDRVLLRRARWALWRADEQLDRAISMPVSDASVPAETSDRNLALHAARKSYKRARYAVELVSDITGADAKRLTGLQDVLGAHQDAIVAGELVRTFAEQAFRDGEDTFGYGEIYADLRAEAEAALADLPRARQRAAGGWLRRAS